MIVSRFADVLDHDGQSIRYQYLEAKPRDSFQAAKPTPVLLIHGFPQTSYQFRHVLDPLGNAGYHVVAPDYRGAGATSKPTGGYDKVRMADDLVRLMTLLGYHRFHLVGHDIGAMIAHAMAYTWPERIASIAWGEACLPGSSFYDRSKFSLDKFHFQFHRLPNGLAERLVSGHEAAYLDQFYDRLLFNASAITKADRAEYVSAYSRPEAMRAAMDVYRAFPHDENVNKELFCANGKSELPCLLLNGAQSDHEKEANELGSTFYASFQTASVAESGHYIAEENPKGFVESLIEFWSNAQRSEKASVPTVPSAGF